MITEKMITLFQLCS